MFVDETAKPQNIGAGGGEPAKDLSSKDRFDALIQLADIWLTRRNNRYQVLLRISAGLWGIMAASIVYVKARPNELVLVAILCVIIVMHIMVARRLQRGNSSDMEGAFKLIWQAEQTLSPPLDFSPAERHLKREHRWRSKPIQNIFAPAFWVLPTIFLALLAYSLLGVQPKG